MESFAVPYTCMFSDGEKEHDKGKIGIHSVLTFKRFQSLISHKTNLPASQVSAVFICRKVGGDSDKKQKLPITESTNFNIILNQHHPSKEKGCYFLVSLKRSKKDRKTPRKRVVEDIDHSSSLTSKASGSPDNRGEYVKPDRTRATETSSFSNQNSALQSPATIHEFCSYLSVPSSPDGIVNEGKSFDTRSIVPLAIAREETAAQGAAERLVGLKTRRGVLPMKGDATVVVASESNLVLDDLKDQLMDCGAVRETTKVCRQATDRLCYLHPVLSFKDCDQTDRDTTSEQQQKEKTVSDPEDQLHSFQLSPQLCFPGLEQRRQLRYIDTLASDESVHPHITSGQDVRVPQKFDRDLQELCPSVPANGVGSVEVTDIEVPTRNVVSDTALIDEGSPAISSGAENQVAPSSALGSHAPAQERTGHHTLTATYAPITEAFFRKSCGNIGQLGSIQPAQTKSAYPSVTPKELLELGGILREIRSSNGTKICKFCFFCREQKYTVPPFHWCVDDRVIFGFRSPVGPIKRPVKTHVEAAA